MQVYLSREFTGNGSLFSRATCSCVLGTTTLSHYVFQGIANYRCYTPLPAPRKRRKVALTLGPPAHRCLGNCLELKERGDEAQTRHGKIDPIRVLLWLCKGHGQTPPESLEWTNMFDFVVFAGDGAIFQPVVQMSPVRPNPCFGHFLKLWAGPKRRVCAL